MNFADIGIVQFQVTDFLFSPMVLMMGLPLILLLVLPMFMNDAETKKDMENLNLVGVFNIFLVGPF